LAFSKQLFYFFIKLLISFHFKYFYFIEASGLLNQNNILIKSHRSIHP